MSEEVFGRLEVYYLCLRKFLAGWVVLFASDKIFGRLDVYYFCLEKFLA